MVLWCLKHSHGSEILIKIKSYRVIDLAKAFSKDAKQNLLNSQVKNK